MGWLDRLGSPLRGKRKWVWVRGQLRSPLVHASSYLLWNALSGATGAEGSCRMVEYWIRFVCHPYTKYYAILIIMTSRLYVHLHICASITCDNYDRYDLWTKDSCMKNSCTKRRCLRGASTDLLVLDKVIWLHFVHEIAVPISRSPQHSWWGLVLAEARPAQWVTSHNLGLFLGRCGLLNLHALYRTCPQDQGYSRLVSIT